MITNAFIQVFLYIHFQLTYNEYIYIYICMAPLQMVVPGADYNSSERSIVEVFHVFILYDFLKMF